MGVGLGAGVGGLAGAEGRVFPGMTLGFEGMGIGIVGTLLIDEDGVMCCGLTGALPCREV